MYNHTPGPWRTNDLITGGTVILHNAKPGYRARLDDAGRFSAEDAALIAAAPDMLAALEGILASFHESIRTDLELANFPALAAVAAAIAKAKGVQP